MKNIHVLPTDKPSSLYFSGNNSELLLSKEPISFRTFERSPQNIYITSDEEIKEGDWTLMFDDLGNLFLCDKPQQYLGIEKGHHLNKGLKKIILTTDQDLIKDGVQPIDDDFLEWFVKNPSCEEAEVKSWIKTYEDGSSFDRIDYEIIIPTVRIYSEEKINKILQKLEEIKIMINIR